MLVKGAESRIVLMQACRFEVTLVADHGEEIVDLIGIRIHIRTRTKVCKDASILRSISVMSGEIGFVAGKQFEDSAVRFDGIFRVVFCLDGAEIAGYPDLEGSLGRGHNICYAQYEAVNSGNGRFSKSECILQIFKNAMCKEKCMKGTGMHMLLRILCENLTG